jgi:hypothetical protein
MVVPKYADEKPGFGCAPAGDIGDHLLDSAGVPWSSRAGRLGGSSPPAARSSALWVRRALVGRSELPDLGGIVRQQHCHAAVSRTAALRAKRRCRVMTERDEAGRIPPVRSWPGGPWSGPLSAGFIRVGGVEQQLGWTDEDARSTA